MTNGTANSRRRSCVSDQVNARSVPMIIEVPPLEGI